MEVGEVLVIIGLLLRAVLKGQELLASAWVSSLISNMNGYKAALNGFQDRYRIVPSDSSKAATIVGNGAINCANSCDDGLINSGDGPGLVNNNPSAAGFYSGPLPATTSELFGGYYGSSKGFLTNSGGGLICVQYTKYFQYGNGQSTVGAFTTALHTGWNLPSKLLGEVDRRTDDGNAVTGKIRNSTLFTDWRNCWGGIAGV